jgi:mercuric ion transport protein
LTQPSNSPSVATKEKGILVAKFMNKSLLKAGVIGSIIAALCCFTPILVILFGALGFSAPVGYLDYVLFPILGLFLVVIVVALVTNRDNAT